MARLAVLIAVMFAVMLAVMAGTAFAQCPMCGQAAEQAGESPGAAKRAFLTGVLFLLLPALSVLGGFATVVVRRLRAEAAEAAAEESRDNQS